VRESVVVVTAGGRGEKQLVGYVVGNDGLLEGEELRRYVAAQLPDHMVPVSIEMVQRWPLTPSGKVDRAGLAAGYGKQATAGYKYVAPQTATEHQLAEIWATVLGVEQVGVEDNFFALGGDSILSLQVVARARVVGLQLTPKELVQYQTLGALAQYAVKMESPAMAPAEESGVAPLTPIQQWFFRQQRPEPNHFNQALLLQLEAGSDVESLRQAVALLVQHHAALRLRFREVATGEWEQWLAEQETNEVFKHYELGGLTEAEQREQLEASAEQLQRSLNLEAGPLLRVAYFNYGERGGRLLLIVHHLVVDGVSWRILLEDLAQLAGGKESSAVDLPGRTTSYQQWARQLQQYAASAALQEEVEYWQEVAAAARRRQR
jgi:aryl carrier-like protein